MKSFKVWSGMRFWGAPGGAGVGGPPEAEIRAAAAAAAAAAFADALL